MVDWIANEKEFNCNFIIKKELLLSSPTPEKSIIERLSVNIMFILNGQLLGTCTFS